jgi:hypothetical protein
MECSVDPDNPAVENIRLDGTYTLASPHAFAGTAESAHVPLFFADTLTSSHVWGHPEHKRILMKKFPAGIVDMETAALARVAQSFSLPIRCLRVISDEAEDSFLEPFAYDPQAGLKTKAGKFLRSGNPVKLLRRWKSNTSIAKACLERFLREYFKTFPDQQSRLR